MSRLQLVELNNNPLSGTLEVTNIVTILNIKDTQLIICNANVFNCIDDDTLYSDCNCPPSKCNYLCCWQEYDLNCPPCNVGFRRNISYGNCSDIDECSINNGGCNSVCSNTIGSYLCSCYEGQTKDINGVCQDEILKLEEIFGMAIGIFLAATIQFIIISELAFRYFNSSRMLNALPTQLNWAFKSAASLFAVANGWKKNDNFFIKYIEKDSHEWDKVTNFLTQDLTKSNIEIENIVAIYNPKLVSQFVLRMKYTQTYLEIKAKHENKTHKNKLRKWVSNEYWSFVRRFEWNKDNITPILPVLHGTDFTVAKMICSNGFANLSLIDSGYFGKGIYFTSNLNYAYSYCFEKTKPTILISYILPGDAYPVIESPTDKKNICMAPVPFKSKYDSHYVLTNKKGLPAKMNNEPKFDEFVIGQEPQIVPAFLLILKPEQKIR